MLTLLLPAAMALGTACTKKAGPAAPPPPVVEVMTATATNVPLSVEFIGQLDSPQNVEIRARVEAFVEKILFAEGKEVKKDDLLFVLDKKPFEERLAAAQGALAEAKAALNKSDKDVARLRPLAEKKAIPQQDLDNALASVDVSKANILTAEARVQSALLDLGYCEVRAPMTGLIGAKQVNIGEVVGKGQPTLLATISTLDPIWFYCNVGEAQFLRAETETRRTGKSLDDLQITLILANGLVHPAIGKFVFIDRAVDVKTGTIRTRAQFPNAEKILRPGMFGRIKVDVGVRADSIMVPERAVVELQGKTFAWLVDAENKATQRAVKVGETIGENVVIVEGVKAGDRIVVEGLQKVREGAPVQPMTAAQLAQAATAQAAKQAEGKAAKDEAGAKHGKE